MRFEIDIFIKLAKSGLSLVMNKNNWLFVEKKVMNKLKFIKLSFSYYF